MRYISILVAAMFLTGCATSKPQTYSVPGLEMSNGMVISDLRPKSEKEKKIFSLIVTNQAYGIYRNAETATDPSPIRLLQHKTYEKFRSSPTPAKVTVYHLVAYTNARAALRKVAAGSVFGIAGALIANSTNNKTLESGVSYISPESLDATSEKEKYKRAFYTPAENPQKATAFVVYIDADINGKRTSMRKISPAVTHGGASSYVSAVEGAVDSFLSNY